MNIRPKNIILHGLLYTHMTGCIPITSFQNPLKNDLTSHHDRKCFWVSCTLIRMSAEQKQVMFLTSYSPEQGIEKMGHPVWYFLAVHWRRCGGIHRVFEMSDPGPNHYSSYHQGLSEGLKIWGANRNRRSLEKKALLLHMSVKI